MAMAASPAYCHALVQRLRSGSSNSQANAAARLAALVRQGGDAAGALAAAGVIPALIQFLKDSSPSGAQKEAATALCRLCLYQPANGWQLVQAGGVGVLAGLLSRADDTAVIAADTLAHIAVFLPEMRREVGAAALSSLLLLLRSGSANVQEPALSPINNL